MFGSSGQPVTPPPPGAVTRDLRGDSWHIQLDLTPQVLSPDIPRETTWDEGEEELAPTCDGLSDGFISASRLAVKAKLFDAVSTRPRSSRRRTAKQSC